MDDIEKGYWVIANQKHLAEFKEDATNRDEFEATIIAGKAGLFLAQIRGHGRVPFDKAVRLARKVQIPKIMLADSILPQLRRATAGRIDYDESAKRGITEIEEHIDTESTLFKVTGVLHSNLGPTDTDLGSLETLSYTATLPRGESEAKTKLVTLGMNEEQATTCLAVQGDFELVKVFKHYGLMEPVLFNEYIWRYEPTKLAHALSQLEPEQKQTIEAIIEMCQGHQGHPAEAFSDYQAVLDLADSVGLLDIVEVKSSDGVQKEFIFTPHLRSEENPTALSNDLLGDIKLFLASMGFGETYSKISRLGGIDREKTINFVEKLIREGEAGDATAIGIDYIMLEERGIVRVEPTRTPPGTRYKMVLLRPEVGRLAVRAIKAASTLERRGILPLSGFQTKTLREGRYFTDVEGGRIRRDPYARLPKEAQESRNYYIKKLRGEL